MSELSEACAKLGTGRVKRRINYLVGFQQGRYQLVDFEIGDVLADAGAVAGSELLMLVIE